MKARDEVKDKLKFGSMFGFSQSLLRGFASIILPMYFSLMNISLVMYGLLLTIGDIVTFLLKPFIGHLTDKFGERKFLILGILIYTFCLFLIGQTNSVFTIAILQVISAITIAFLLIIIITFALRSVKQKPDSKVAFFGGITGLGWVAGLLLPGFIIDKFGISIAFTTCLVIGPILAFIAYKFLKVYEVKPVSLKPSFDFIKKVPLPLIFKTIDMAVFTAFLAFFIRFALVSLGLSRSIIAILIAFECLAFGISQLIIGKKSNPQRRRYWIPIGMFSHIAGIYFLLSGISLLDYFIAAGLIGIAGAFIDIWVYSYISEKVRILDKGKTIATTGWCYDLGTIVGIQVPILFTFLHIAPFMSMFLFPIAGLIIYTLYITTFKNIAMK